MSGSESLTWVKSRLCEASSCVEVAVAGEEILVRNSTDKTGPVLTFTRDEWAAFVGGVRHGDFDFGFANPVQGR